MKRKDKMTQMFDEVIANDFQQLLSGEWLKISDSRQQLFKCQKNTPLDEWKKRYPDTYQEELNEFFDLVHPY